MPRHRNMWLKQVWLFKISMAICGTLSIAICQERNWKAIDFSRVRKIFFLYTPDIAKLSLSRNCHLAASSKRKMEQIL